MMIRLTLITLLSATALALSAQTEVIFRVDMNEQITAGEFDPAVDVLRVAGDFQGAAGGTPWVPMAPDSSNVLRDADGDGLYTVNFAGVPAGDYQFKYVINDWSDTNEFRDGPPAEGDCFTQDPDGNTNRIFSVPESDSLRLPAFVYNTCTVSDLVASNRSVRPVAAIAITPNPVTDRSVLTFEAKPGATYSVAIVNTVGAVVRDYASVVGGAVEIDRAGIPAGFYLVNVTASTGERGARRLVVR